MPALPGAQKISVTRGDCRSFHTKACSRPPPPKTRIRILLRSENAREQARVGCGKWRCQRGGFLPVIPKCPILALRNSYRLRESPIEILAVDRDSSLLSREMRA